LWKSPDAADAESKNCVLPPSPPETVPPVFVNVALAALDESLNSIAPPTVLGSFVGVDPVVAAKTADPAVELL
jgi:hypothetical protein